MPDDDDPYLAEARRRGLMGGAGTATAAPPRRGLSTAEALATLDAKPAEDPYVAEARRRGISAPAPSKPRVLSTSEALASIDAEPSAPRTSGIKGPGFLSRAADTAMIPVHATVDTGAEILRGVGPTLHGMTAPGEVRQEGEANDLLFKHAGDVVAKAREAADRDYPVAQPKSFDEDLRDVRDPLGAEERRRLAPRSEPMEDFSDGPQFRDPRSSDVPPDIAARVGVDLRNAKHPDDVASYFRRLSLPRKLALLKAAGVEGPAPISGDEKFRGGLGTALAATGMPVAFGAVEQAYHRTFDDPVMRRLHGDSALFKAAQAVKEYNPAQLAMDALSLPGKGVEALTGSKAAGEVTNLLPWIAAGGASEPGGVGSNIRLPAKLPSALLRFAPEGLRPNGLDIRGLPTVESMRGPEIPAVPEGGDVRVVTPLEQSVDTPARGATPDVLPMPRGRMRATDPVVGFAEKFVPKTPPSTGDAAGVAAPQGLAARVAKAGFKDMRSAVEAVMRGDENALQMLKPADVDALVGIAENVRPKYVGERLTRKSVERALPRRMGANDIVGGAPAMGPAPATDFVRDFVYGDEPVRAGDKVRPRGGPPEEPPSGPEPAPLPPPAPRPAPGAAVPEEAPPPRRLAAGERLDPSTRAAGEPGADAGAAGAPREHGEGRGLGLGEQAPERDLAAGGSARRGVEAAPESGTVERIPVASIEVDPALQFKRVTDERTGTGKRLRDVASFDPEKGGVVAVWRDPATGATKIVNGFHRLELAQRAGTEAIDARFISAADAGEARAKGALLNIAEGQGTPLDVAAFLRESGLRGEDARGFLREHDVPLTSTTARDGLALSQLEDGLFDQYARGELREPAAVAIADSGLDAPGQRALASAVASKSIEPSEIPALARRVQGAATTTQTTASLFGDVTEGKNLFALEAKVETQLVRELARDKRLFGSAAKNAGTLERGGNVIDVERSTDLAARSAQVAEVVKRLAGSRGAVADAVSSAAKEVDAGEMTLADAVARARIDVEDAVRAELGPRTAGADLPRPEAPAPTLFSAKARARAPGDLAVEGEPEPVRAGTRLRAGDKVRTTPLQRMRADEPIRASEPARGRPQSELEQPERAAAPAAEPGLFESGQFGPEPTERFGSRAERGSIGLSRGGDGPTGEGVGMVARGLGAIAKGTGELVSKLSSRSIDFIRRQYGEAGEDLAQRIQDVQSDTRARSGRDIAELNAAVRDIAIPRRSWVSRRLRALVEGRETPKGAAEAKLVDTVRRVFERVGRFANESGVMIDDERTGPRPVPTGWREFFPQMLKGEIRDALRRGDPEMIAKLRELNVGKGKAFATAEEMDAALARYFERRPESFHPGTELPRRFHYPDSWVDPDGLHAVLSYVRRAYQNAAEHRWFEYRDADTGAKGQGVLGDLYARIEREFGHADAAEAKTLTQRILGRHVEDSSRFAQLWHKAQGVEGLLTAARLFVGNIRLPFQQVTQLRNLATLVGEQRAGQGLWRTATRWKAARDLAVREGAVQPESTVSRMLGTEDVGGRMLRKGHEAVSIGNLPVSKSDEFWRTVASEAAPGFAEDLVDAMQREGKLGGNNATWAARTLEKLDMTPNEIAEFRAGEPSERTLTKFRQRVVSHSQIETGVGDRPVYFTRPGTQWLARLKSFGIGDARFAVRFAFTEAGHGNLAPLARYIAYTVGTGEALNAAYSALFGPRAGRPTVDDILKKKDLGLLGERLVDDLKTASFFGMLGSVGLEAVPDDSGKTGLRRVAERLAKPPVVDTVEDVGGAIDRAIGPEPRRHGPPEDQRNALEQLLRDQVVAVKQVPRVVQMATPEGVRKEEMDVARGAPGSHVDRKDRATHIRELKEREEFLRELYEALGAGK